jgi:hypothetical protein
MIRYAVPFSGSSVLGTRYVDLVAVERGKWLGDTSSL